MNAFLPVVIRYVTICGRPAWQTLERAYLLKLGSRVMERPQYMFMRIAIGIHGEDLEVNELFDDDYTVATFVIALLVLLPCALIILPSGFGIVLPSVSLV